MMVTDYAIMISQADALTDGVNDAIANLSNLSALIYTTLENINWAGFYVLKDGRLVLGPFQGKPACVFIQPGKGVCGTAVSKDATQVVPDVHRFPGHIACDSASNSEIVIPIHSDGHIFGVLDIDSPLFDRFTDNDIKGLEAMAMFTERGLKSWKF